MQSGRSLKLMDKHNNHYVYQAITQEDVPLILEWFKQPHVMKWWPYPEPEEDFFGQFMKRCRTKDVFAYIAKLNGVPFGFIQYYYWNPDDETTGGKWIPTDLPKTTIGIDQFIGDPNYLGKGYGAHMLQEFITYVRQVLDPEVTTIIVDPKPANIVAIKCYEKVGFQRVGIVDAPWGQTLFMRYDIVK